MKMYFKHLISFFMIIFILISYGFVSYATEGDEPTTEYPKTTEYPDDPERLPDTVGDAIIVMDAATGQILYEKNAYSKMYPASITKIMTSLIALENGNLSDTITMSENAVWGIERGSSHIALDVGEEINFEDALYAVLVVSANEAAWGVAEHIGGTLENFCDMMNQKAEELGCVSTHFVNANGLHDDDHYTCAYDMALITREALKYDKFREITATTYYSIPPTNMKEDTRELWQNNKLIKEGSDYYYEYCEGGKTGFTDQALGTLVTWAKKDDVELICVTMHNHPTVTSYTDSKALYEYFFNNYSYAEPLKDFTFSDEDIKAAENELNKYFDGINGGQLSLDVDTGVKLLVRNSFTKDNMAITYDASYIDEASNQAGTLTIGDDSETYAVLPVYYSGYIFEPIPQTETTDALEALTKETSGKSNNSQQIMLVLSIAAIILMVLLIALVIIRINHVKKQRALNKRIREKRRINNRK